ncbi:ADP-ribosylglycohydrolase family protein [Saccharibacillus sp. CPCC 101409]|uniref:ADP-ribosylglycohydrolase family protein n=1 Tax=Saccharibacillus sp. CPCC 101409 TaxID=3058041 RepID=UPI0026720F89|nr:ADP-ribosylglycohydrolase family protein [Saccharibacillus sp. CPCC 101409]MDO3411073.1 ADP-ribosylglycohydrolase family protein [Saccharibacillus sp. CPCC 101409]
MEREPNEIPNDKAQSPDWREDDRLRGALLGLTAADALGVPVEFRSRSVLDRNPVTDMFGYGTYNQPPGTWSDDSTMTWCTVESLALHPEGDTEDMAGRFVRWLEKGYMTPRGELFDIGNATREALERYRTEAVWARFAGLTHEQSNGNGSLMRILPLAFYTYGMPAEERDRLVGEVSSITHRHPRSLLACHIYVETAQRLLDGRSAEQAYREAAAAIPERFAGHAELRAYERVLGGRLAELKRDEIRSSGYVVDTLEAALWCVLTTDNYRAAALKAVNLGEDTDTTAAVAGGLAGILYGEAGIPREWLAKLAKLEELRELCGRFGASLARREERGW